MLQAEVLQAEVLQAEMLQGSEVLQAEMLQEPLLQASLLRRCPGLRWLRLRLVLPSNKRPPAAHSTAAGRNCL